jgi:LCP family protein required for cell wall assembly
MKKSNQIALLITLGAVLAAGFFAAYYINQSHNYNKLFAAVEEDAGYYDEIGAKSSIINILFLGIDKIEGGESRLGIYRSDTIAFARIDLDNKKVKVLNIPRDTYCYVPVEDDYDKINHAYAYGSLEGKAVQASIDAIHHYIGKEFIDYYFAMDLEPIPSIVDELGGVLLDVEIEMKTYGANLDKGLQWLNGRQVYDYIHWRFSPGGDIDRIKRQQKFMSTFFKQQRDNGKLLETLYVVLKHDVHIETDLTM